MPRAQFAMRCRLMWDRLRGLVHEFGCHLKVASARWESITEERKSVHLSAKVLGLGRSVIGTTVCRSKWNWFLNLIIAMIAMRWRFLVCLVAGGKWWVI